MPRIAAIASLCALAAAPAHADGYYFEQTVGVSTGRGTAAAPLDVGLHTRLGIGLIRGGLSIEPWISSDLTFDRSGATLELFGGSPAMGHADLEGMGLDVKYAEPLSQNVGVYVRGGPRFATGAGALDGFDGPGFGVGTGIQLVGRVRALGFLWAPLFFFKKGPYARGAIFFDEGLDYYRLSATPMGTRAVPVLATNIGFAIGSDF